MHNGKFLEYWNQPSHHKRLAILALMAMGALAVGIVFCANLIFKTFRYEIKTSTENRSGVTNYTTKLLEYINFLPTLINRIMTKDIPDAISTDIPDVIDIVFCANLIFKTFRYEIKTSTENISRVTNYIIKLLEYINFLPTLINRIISTDISDVISTDIPPVISTDIYERKEHKNEELDQLLIDLRQKIKAASEIVDIYEHRNAPNNRALLKKIIHNIPNKEKGSRQTSYGQNPEKSQSEVIENNYIDVCSAISEELDNAILFFFKSIIDQDMSKKYAGRKEFLIEKEGKFLEELKKINNNFIENTREHVTLYQRTNEAAIKSRELFEHTPTRIGETAKENADLNAQHQSPDTDKAKNVDTEKSLHPIASSSSAIDNGIATLKANVDNIRGEVKSKATGLAKQILDELTNGPQVPGIGPPVASDYTPEEISSKLSEQLSNGTPEVSKR